MDFVAVNSGDKIVYCNVPSACLNINVTLSPWPVGPYVLLELQLHRSANDVSVAPTYQWVDNGQSVHGSDQTYTVNTTDPHILAFVVRLQRRENCRPYWIVYLFVCTILIPKLALLTCAGLEVTRAKGDSIKHGSSSYYQTCCKL